MHVIWISIFKIAKFLKVSMTGPEGKLTQSLNFEVVLDLVCQNYFNSDSIALPTRPVSLSNIAQCSSTNSSSLAGAYST